MDAQEALPLDALPVDALLAQLVCDGKTLIQLVRETRVAH
jgi:hypothetical protein